MSNRGGGDALPTTGECMRTPVVTITPETSLRDALAMLSARQIRGAPVVVGSTVVGILSNTDVMEFVATTPGVPAGELEEEASPDEEDGDLADFLLGVWSHGGPSAWERGHHVDVPEWDVLEDHTVEEAMSSGAVRLRPDTPLPEAARQMVRHGADRAVVMVGERLVGILTATDVMRALAQQVPAEGPGAPA